MKNNFKLFFLMMTFMSTLFLISSISWMNLWIWLEINLISFIAYIINNENKLSIECALIYFLIQTIASILLLFSILMMNFKNNFMNMLIISLLLKMGSAPFHIWLPLIIEGLGWMEIFILLTWQKINPLFMMFMNNYFMNLFKFIILSLIIGTISGLNFSSLKKMISFSSINQLSWMLISLSNNKLIKLLILFYMFLMWTITKSLHLFNLNYLNQLFNLNLKNKFIKLFIFMNFLSLGGLPPFLGFFPKMLIIMKINNLIMFFMILYSLISLFMYLRIIYSMLMLNSLKMNKIYNLNNYKKFFNLMKFSMINNFLLILLLFI